MKNPFQGPTVRLSKGYSCRILNVAAAGAHRSDRIDVIDAVDDERTSEIRETAQDDPANVQKPNRTRVLLDKPAAFVRVLPVVLDSCLGRQAVGPGLISADVKEIRDSVRGPSGNCNPAPETRSGC